MNRISRDKWDYYNSKEELIPYINGFLFPLEIMNDYVDHGHTFYLDEIQRLDSLESSIIKHLEDDRYKVKVNILNSWAVDIKETGQSFFDGVLNRMELGPQEKQKIEKYKKNETIREVTNFNLVNDAFVYLIKKFISTDSVVYLIDVDWSSGYHYENYYKDYLIENNRGLFYLHFGVSD